MKEQFEIQKNYRQDEVLRSSFNELAKETFGLEFEGWYRNGYWTEKYNPYSIVIENKVVSNISINKMEFLNNGTIKKYLQLGTVMTDRNYRNRGFVKMIMQEIEKEFCDIVDGYYLFANSSVLEFYPKFGYRECTEYQYSKILTLQKHMDDREKGKKNVKQMQMNNKEQWSLLESAIVKSVSNSAFEMKNNKELIMFYVTQFMQHNVYYIESESAYVIAEINNGELFIHGVFSEKVIDMDRIVEAFEEEVDKVVFGFTPLTNQGYQVEPLREENTTLFLKGQGFDLFEQNELIFPTLSHA